jgi:hypothetical protein
MIQFKKVMTGIIAKVLALESKLASEDVGKILADWLYANNFYPLVVRQAINRLPGQKSAKEQSLAVLRTRTVQADLAVLWWATGLPR